MNVDIFFESMPVSFMSELLPIGTCPKRPQTRKAHTKNAANLKGLSKAMFCK